MDHRFLPICSAAVAVCLAGLPAGCNPDYGSDGHFPAASITQKYTWKAGGDLRMPENAIDGNLATVAETGPSAANRSLVIDLGKVCVFNTVIVEHGRDEHGFCRRVGISTSIDGQEYTPRAALPGTRKVSTFSLVTPVLGRYVRLQVIQPGNSSWTIAEVHLR